MARRARRPARWPSEKETLRSLSAIASAGTAGRSSARYSSGPVARAVVDDDELERRVVGVLVEPGDQPFEVIEAVAGRHDDRDRGPGVELRRLARAGSRISAASSARASARSDSSRSSRAGGAAAVWGAGAGAAAGAAERAGLEASSCSIRFSALARAPSVTLRRSVRRRIALVTPCPQRQARELAARSMSALVCASPRRGSRPAARARGSALRTRPPDAGPPLGSLQRSSQLCHGVVALTRAAPPARRPVP